LVNALKRIYAAEDCCRSLASRALPDQLSATQLLTKQTAFPLMSLHVLCKSQMIIKGP